ncbi:hypothetical protein [Labilibaculum euxinus]
MYRIYLDWNVISQLKSDNKSEIIQELADLLEKNKDNILVPYSTAHILDLLKGSENPNNLHYINRDLDYIDILSNQNCIQNDISTKTTNAYIGSARDLFDQLKENYHPDCLHPDFIEKSFEGTELPNLGKTFTDLWKITPSGIDFTNIDSNEESKRFFDKFYPRTRANNSLYSLMVDSSEFFKAINSNHEIYKSLTDTCRNHLKIDPKVVSNYKDPITGIGEILKTLGNDIDFDKLNAVHSQDENSVLNNHLSKYMAEYTNLDMLGYHPDKLNNKNLFSNFTNDSQHSYFAGFCDFFISFEKKLIKKSNILYKKHSINTLAYTPKEFIDIYRNSFSCAQTWDDLFVEINNIISNAKWQEIMKHTFENSRIFLYHPEAKLLSFFNSLYLKLDANNRHTIYLRYVHKNFSPFVFYYELSMLIQKLTSIFGIDYYALGMFSQKDKDELANRNWQGRYWGINNYLIQLYIDEQTGHFELAFEEITEELKKEYNSKPAPPE